MSPRPLNSAVSTGFPEHGWIKSSRSGPNGGDCVEVNQQLSEIVGVRDSKRPDEAALAFERPRWSAFVAAVAAGRLSRGA